MDMSLARIEAIALETIGRFPEPFREAARSVIIQVADWPDDDLLDAPAGKHGFVTARDDGHF